MLETKGLILLLPILTAILWGLSYALAGKAVETHSFIAFYIYEGTASVVMGLIAWMLVKEPGDMLSPFKFDADGIYFFGSLAASAVAGFLTLYVLKHVSPTYAAVGEIAYPLFVPIFAYLLFNQRQWDWPTIVGGTLIFSGLFVMIYGQHKMSQEKAAVAKLSGTFIGGA